MIAVCNAIGARHKKPWSSYWTPQNAIVRDSAINTIILTYDKKVKAADIVNTNFTIEGNACTSATLDATGKIATLVFTNDFVSGAIIPLVANSESITVTNSVSPAGYAFKLPASGVINVPVNTTDNWTTTRTGGDPTPAISVVDITDANDIAKIGSNKALQLVTGITAHANSGVKYTFPVGVKPINFDNYTLCIWVKFVAGSGITDWDKSTELVCQLRETFAAAYGITLATVNVEYAGSGWYAFSAGVMQSLTAVNLENINELILYVARTASTNNPTIQIGRIAIVPKHAKAQLTFQCDGGYASHENIANLLTANGMKGTFYVEGGPLQELSVAQLTAMQSNGHLIAAYCRNWGSATDLAGRLVILQAAQSYLTTNGFTGGRHFIHGITSKMTEELWEGIIPKYADTCGYSMQANASQYYKTYMPRYHEFNAANKTNCINRVNYAVEAGARIGILCHAQIGADWTAFEDFVTNTLVPLKNAGSLDVITVKEAFESA